MQAQDLFPQVKKLRLAEQLALLNFLVQLIQQEVIPQSAPTQPLAVSLMGLAKTTETAPTDAEIAALLDARRVEKYLS